MIWNELAQWVVMAVLVVVVIRHGEEIFQLQKWAEDIRSNVIRARDQVDGWVREFRDSIPWWVKWVKR